MSDTYTQHNNQYADYHAFDEQVHSRKGKTKNKHNKAYGNHKIALHKKKNNIDSNIWVSSYDVYKFVADKKRTHSYAKTMRSKGWDYKHFVSHNEIPKDQNDTQNLDLVDQDDVFWDSWDNYSDNCDNWDSYSDYSYDISYSEYDDWDDLYESRSTCSRQTCKTNRTIQNVFGY